MFGSFFSKPGKDLLISGDAQAHQFLADSWQWRIGDMRALHFSACGDVFLTDSQDAVHWLQTTSGTFSRLADSVAAFEASLKQKAFCEEVLQAPLVAGLKAKLGPLPVGRCYSYKIMPVLGGGPELENRVTLPLYEHVGLNGDIRVQIKDLPDGAVVQVRVVD